MEAQTPLTIKINKLPLKNIRDKRPFDVGLLRRLHLVIVVIIIIKQSLFGEKEAVFASANLGARLCFPGSESVGSGGGMKGCVNSCVAFINSVVVCVAERTSEQLSVLRPAVGRGERGVRVNPCRVSIVAGGRALSVAIGGCVPSRRLYWLCVRGAGGAVSGGAAGTARGRDGPQCADSRRRERIAADERCCCNR